MGVWRNNCVLIGSLVEWYYASLLNMQFFRMGLDPRLIIERLFIKRTLIEDTFIEGLKHDFLSKTIKMRIIIEITFARNCNFENLNYYTDTEPGNVYHAFLTTGPNLIGTQIIINWKDKPYTTYLKYSI